MIYTFLIFLPLVNSFIFYPPHQIVDISLKKDILSYVTSDALIGRLNITSRNRNIKKIKMDCVSGLSDNTIYGYKSGTHLVQFSHTSTKMLRPLLFFDTISKGLSVGVDFLNNILIWNNEILVKTLPIDCPQVSCACVYKNDLLLGCIDGNIFIFSLVGHFITYKTSIKDAYFSPVYKIAVGNYQNGIAIACAHINGSIHIVSLKEPYSLVKCEKLDIIHIPHIKKLQLYRNILIILHENRNMFIYDFYNHEYIKKEIVDDVILNENYYIKYKNKRFIIKSSQIN